MLPRMRKQVRQSLTRREGLSHPFDTRESPLVKTQAYGPVTPKTFDFGQQTVRDYVADLLVRPLF